MFNAKNINNINKLFAPRRDDVLEQVFGRIS